MLAEMERGTFWRIWQFPDALNRKILELYHLPNCTTSPTRAQMAMVSVLTRQDPLFAGPWQGKGSPLKDGHHTTSRTHRSSGVSQS